MGNLYRSDLHGAQARVGERRHSGRGSKPAAGGRVGRSNFELRPARASGFRIQGGI